MCVFMDAHMYALSMVEEERDVVATGVKLAGTAEGWSLSPILSLYLPQAFVFPQFCAVGHCWLGCQPDTLLCSVWLRDSLEVQT